jgi:hypothetical protein
MLQRHCAGALRPRRAVRSRFTAVDLEVQMVSTIIDGITLQPVAKNVSDLMGDSRHREVYTLYRAADGTFFRGHAEEAIDPASAAEVTKFMAQEGVTVLDSGLL